MKEPKRLLDRFGGGPHRNVLAAGARERAPDGVRQRVEARVVELALFGGAAGAAGAGTAAGAASPGAGGAAAGTSAAVGGSKASPALGVLLAKWLAVGGVAGVISAYAGSELYAERPARPANSAAASVAEPPRPPPPLAPRANPNSEPVTPEVTIEGRPAPSTEARGDVHIGKTATLSEADSLARAEAAARKDPKRALELVDEHLSRFRSGESVARARALRAKLVLQSGSAAPVRK